MGVFGHSVSDVVGRCLELWLEVVACACAVVDKADHGDVGRVLSINADEFCAFANLLMCVA